MPMYGERLKLRRKARRLSQNELGRMIGCVGHTISDYERKNEQPDTDVSRRIEEVLGEF